MHLTKIEEQILKGEQGVAKQKAIQVLVKLGDKEKAENLISIRSVHIPGVSFTELSERDVAELEKWAGHFPKVAVPTTLNAAGVSSRTPDLIIDLHKQAKIIDAYKAMHTLPILTTSPYAAGYEPKAGNDIAWGHKSAVCYANAVLGACTNNHTWETALASALLGCTPNFGMHQQENRQPEITLNMTEKLFGYEDFSALGYYASKEFPDKIVNFTFPGKPHRENLQALASGWSVNAKKMMFTAGAEGRRGAGAANDKVEEVVAGFEAVDSVFQDFTGDDADPDFVALGCPHLPEAGFQKIGRVLKGKKLQKHAKFWVCTAEKIRADTELDGYEDSIKKAGCTTVTDVCPCLVPIKKLGVKCVMSNSVELCAEAQKQGLKAKLSSFDDIIKWGFR